MTKEYDYIIAGSGCSGLSLLYRMLDSGTLKDKKILVIEKEDKNKNDRTWCYWEAGMGLFEHLVIKRWKNLTFSTGDFAVEADMKRYEYKMIRGIDFYEHILSKAKEFENVDLVKETIGDFHPSTDHALVQTDRAKYRARYVFNSTGIGTPHMDVRNTLLQHFEGWVIRLEEPFFDENKATLMDFSVSQEHGTTFVYVLPTSTTEALVEYTFFSERILEKEQYHELLTYYIANDLGIQNYEIAHREFGIIPMSLVNFSSTMSPNKRIINIGTSGGFTRASTGYTFQNIQRKTSEIVANLEKNEPPLPDETFRDKMFQWYDKTLLDVLISKKLGGKEVFHHMFRKIEFESILAFLGNESTPYQELKIMNSVPLGPFMGSGIKQLVKFNA